MTCRDVSWRGGIFALLRVVIPQPDWAIEGERVFSPFKEYKLRVSESSHPGTDYLKADGVAVPPPACATLAGGARRRDSWALQLEEGVYLSIFNGLTYLLKIRNQCKGLTNGRCKQLSASFNTFSLKQRCCREGGLIDQP